MKKMTLMQHFSELRRRILWIAFVFAIAFVAGWCLAPMMQEFLTRPLLSVWENGKFLYTGIADGLMIKFSMASLFALVVVLPVALWHLWAFVAPGLKQAERRLIWPVLVLSPVLFAAGCAFAFWVMFPVVFKFFVDVNLGAPINAEMMPAVREYLGVAIGMLRIFGVVFQLPLVMVLLNRVGVLSRDAVMKMRRYAIVIIAIVAAILTPPDVISQVMLAVPMWLLFEISILCMRHD